MQIVMLVLLALLSIIPILTAKETLKILKMRKEIQLDNWSIRPVFSQIERRKLLFKCFNGNLKNIKGGKKDGKIFKTR